MLWKQLSKYFEMCFGCVFRKTLSNTVNWSCLYLGANCQMLGSDSFVKLLWAFCPAFWPTSRSRKRSHHHIECPASNQRVIFGCFLFIIGIWYRSWGVARLLKGHSSQVFHCWLKFWDKPKVHSLQIWSFYVLLFSRYCCSKLTIFLLRQCCHFVSIVTED